MSKDKKSSKIIHFPVPADSPAGQAKLDRLVASASAKYVLDLFKPKR